MKMSIVLALLACFVSSHAQADESLLDGLKVSIGLPAYTHHLKRANEFGKSWNEDNKGAFLEVEKEGSSFGVLLGSYNNSYYVRSNLVGVSYRPLSCFGEYVKAGLIAGLVTGYKDANNKPMPIMAALSFKVQLSDKVGMHLMGVPTVGQKSGFVASQVVLSF